jgi:hypothetical protein
MKICGTAIKRSAAPVRTATERREQAAIFASPERRNAAGTTLGRAGLPRAVAAARARRHDCHYIRLTGRP